MSEPQQASWYTRSSIGKLGEARRFVRTMLLAWGWRTALADVEVITHELVTNACEHAGGDVEVRLALDELDQLRIEVLDSNANAIPVVRYNHRHGSYGLHIVEAIAIRWGFEPVGTRKSVWAELDLVHPVIVAAGGCDQAVTTLEPHPMTRQRRAR
jgi:hypothetical protein